MERTILHSDLNGFYAAVEIMLNPSLAGKAVAVCGDSDSRHGIVLAKSEKAKAYGISTGDVTWEAKQKCKNLIIIPPHYEQYLKYSALTREVYERFTDKIEPYGIDEAWIDITGCDVLFGDGEKVANKIRQTVKNELGLTVSVGVSFNKVFAKLGSDLKKPDAVTVISKENFKEKLWSLPAKEMIFVGRATEKKLLQHGIRTIGDVADTPVNYMQYLFGKNGVMLWRYANGLDDSRVADNGFVPPIKSVSHGTTTSYDLTKNEQIRKVLADLSVEVTHKLRQSNLCAKKVGITVKNNAFEVKDFQASLPCSTQNSEELSLTAFKLFLNGYKWEKPVRMLTIRAINLVSDKIPEQLDLFFNQNIEEDFWSLHDKREKAEVAVEDIRRRFGRDSVFAASLIHKNDIISGRPVNTMPSRFNQ